MTWHQGTHTSTLLHPHLFPSIQKFWGKGGLQCIIHDLHSADLKGKCNMCSVRADVHWGVFFFVFSHRVLGKVFGGLFVVAHRAAEVLDLFFQSFLIASLAESYVFCLQNSEFSDLTSLLKELYIYVMVMKQYLPNNFHVILFKNKTIM